MLTLDCLTLRQDDFTLTANWSLKAGQRLALIGPSGAGKSTLLAGIAGFLTPAQGQVRWQGEGLNMLPPGKRPIAMLFQDGNLFPHLSVSQNIGLGLRPNLKLTATDRDLIANAMARVGLTGMENRRPAALSGGQQSRAALARVLVMKRPVLLLDEPFSALGPALRGEMLDLVAQVLDESGATLIMVTHDPNDAARIADLISVADNGTAGPPHPTHDLLADPTAALREYLGK